jgi:Family of unknown function (DUF6527)
MKQATIPLRIVDNPGEPYDETRVMPGDMWHVPELDNDLGACWIVVLPNMRPWQSNQKLKTGHWDVTGTAPKLDVHPIIWHHGGQGWHGWIKNGELVTSE